MSSFNSRLHFTDYKSILHTTDEKLCQDNLDNGVELGFYNHKYFAMAMLFPVILSTLFVIPHWWKQEKPKGRLLKTLPFVIFQLYPQCKMAEILYLALWKTDKQWKAKKDFLVKEMGSIGNFCQEFFKL